jgi:hypothetical protein
MQASPFFKFPLQKLLMQYPDWQSVLLEQLSPFSILIKLLFVYWLHILLIQLFPTQSSLDEQFLPYPKFPLQKLLRQ